MRNKLSAILVGLACLCICIFLFWLFNLHGTRGLLQVERIFWVVVSLLILLVLTPSLFCLIGWLKRNKRKIQTGFNITAIVISSIAVVVVAAGYFYISGFPSPPVPETPRLVLVAGSGTGGIPDVAVIATSPQSSQYTLDWYKAGESVYTSVESGKSLAHTFILGNLDPVSEYRYRLNTGVEYHFRTPDASSPLHFAVGNDAHFGAGDNRPDLTARMLALIADPANGYDYFFSLGDLVEFGFRVEQWQEAFAALSPISASIPACYIAGNHDTLFTGVDRFLDYCYPAGVETKTGSPLWYRFDVGNIHFLVLDLEWSVESFSARQAEWLENELKSIPPDDWTIVLSHGYFYASGSIFNGWKWYDNPEAIERTTPLFERYDVDIVFSGHLHQMELLEKAGVTYVITGSLGGVPDPDRTYISPASLWYASGQYGFVDVTIKTEQATVVFRDSAGLELKNFVINRKRPGNRK